MTLMVCQEVRSQPAMPNQRRLRVLRQVASEPSEEIIFELLDDNEEECSSSSSGDEVPQHVDQEENPSATSQRV